MWNKIRIGLTYMRIICTSDLHGQLFPPENLKDSGADVMVIAGDICPLRNHSTQFQESWLSTNFSKWAREAQNIIPNIIFIAGNHDFFFEKCNTKNWVTYFTGNNIHYLQDSGVTIDGIKFWGTPWQRRFYDWAFNLDEEDLASKWALIPEETDVIICHGPAYGYGDKVPKYGNPRSEQAKDDEHVGSKAMLSRIQEVGAKLYVCGHIHKGYGIANYGKTKMVNASFVNEKYIPTNMPILVEI